MEFTRKTLRTQSYLYVDRECPYGPEIGPAMGSAFAEVHAFLEANGIKPISRPMTVYMSMDPAILRFRGGVIVSAKNAAKAAGAVKSDKLAAGEAITTTHVGPYDTLNQSHQALWAYMDANGIPGGFPIWEIYVDDPTVTPAGTLRTEIFRRIG